MREGHQVGAKYDPCYDMGGIANGAIDARHDTPARIAPTPMLLNAVASSVILALWMVFIGDPPTPDQRLFLPASRQIPSGRNTIDLD